MNTNGILREKLLSVLEKETGEDITIINPDQDINEQVSLDSLQLVSIMARIEKEFNVDLSPAVMGLRTLNEFIQVLAHELSKVQNVTSYN